MSDIYDKDGRYTGRSDSSGDLWDKDGRYAGRIDGDGDIYDKDGRYSGRVNSSGDYYDKDGRYGGRSDSDGNLYGKDGAYIGRGTFSNQEEITSPNLTAGTQTGYVHESSVHSEQKSADSCTANSGGGSKGRALPFPFILFVVIGGLFAGLIMAGEILFLQHVEAIYAPFMDKDLYIFGIGYLLLVIGALIRRGYPQSRFVSFLKFIGVFALIPSVYVILNFRLGLISFWGLHIELASGGITSLEPVLRDPLIKGLSSIDNVQRMFDMLLAAKNALPDSIPGITLTARQVMLSDSRVGLGTIFRLLLAFVIGVLFSGVLILIPIVLPIVAIRLLMTPLKFLNRVA